MRNFVLKNKNNNSFKFAASTPPPPIFRDISREFWPTPAVGEGLTANNEML